jgi:hypothetical protein
LACLAWAATLFGSHGPAAARPAAPEEFDVVVYGGTSAAIIAAVQADRLGQRVAIVCPETHLGGLTSGGLGWTDAGNTATIGGLAREFYRRIWRHYDRPEAWRWEPRDDFANRGQDGPAIDAAQRAMWTFEPHVAEAVFEDFVREHDIPVYRDEWLDRGAGVEKVGPRITTIAMLSGRRFAARVFLDATYEGDLLAAAGVAYRVGRESQREYDEQYAGVQTGVLHHRHHFGVLPTAIDPHVQTGDPASGLLPLIGPDPPGEFGAADAKVQAYCFRMCLTDHPDNRVAIPAPPGYNPARYELLARVFAAGWRETFNKFDRIPNRKTDVNNHGPVGSDFLGGNDHYPEASYDRRREIVAAHRAYQLGLYYFLANDSRVPDDVRRQMRRWGLARDEFADNEHWPRQLYIREARRMVGEFVMTEHEALNRRPAPQPVGMGSYSLDSHNVQRYVTPAGAVQNEGDIGVAVRTPYAIAYGALAPKRDECDNLLVPVCVSSTHIAFGSIRMEPVFMILGQSAATAAAIAIERDAAVQDVPYQQLRERLLQGGQILER